MRRRLARERAVQALYAYSIAGPPLNLVLQRLPQMLETANPDQGHYFFLLCQSTVDHLDIIDSSLSGIIEHWNPERVNLVDRAMLRLAVCEILFMPDVPPKVTINEYIEIAKEMGDDKSPVFLNGVLDKLLSQINKQKTGNPTP